MKITKVHPLISLGILALLTTLLALPWLICSYPTAPSYQDFSHDNRGPLFAQVGVFEFALAITKLFEKLFSDKLALDFLFGGKVQPFHKTKFVVEKFISRYEQSINALNKAIILNVAFVPLALLPSGNTVKIPMIDLEISRLNWLRVCPLISYGLQIFVLVALCWFLVMRRGLVVLRREIGDAEHFGDVSNILLTGVLGSLWMFDSIRRHFPSKLQLIWFIPLTGLVVLVMVSPSFLCGYFVHELFASHDLALGLTYLVMLIPSVALSLALIGTSALAGMRELDDHAT